MEDARIILQKVVRNIDGRLQIMKVEYDLEDVSNIRFGTYKDFHSETDISGNGVNPDDKCIYITFYPNSSEDMKDATFNGDWEICFEW